MGFQSLLSREWGSNDPDSVLTFPGDLVFQSLLSREWGSNQNPEHLVPEVQVGFQSLLSREWGSNLHTWDAELTGYLPGFNPF